MSAATGCQRAPALSSRSSKVFMNEPSSDQPDAKEMLWIGAMHSSKKVLNMPAISGCSSLRPSIMELRILSMRRKPKKAAPSLMLRFQARR